MLVVALATVLAVSMMRNQNIALRYADGLFSQDQAVLYTQGAEGFVQDLLARDRERRQTQQAVIVDHLGEAWAKPFPPFPGAGRSWCKHGLIGRAEGASISICCGGTGAINIGGPERVSSAFSTNLDLPDNLDVALIDWMDDDNEPNGTDGAEEDYYTRLPRPYRAANQSLARCFRTAADQRDLHR
jgi:general secretion pathway protein K